MPCSVNTKRQDVTPNNHLYVIIKHAEFFPISLQSFKGPLHLEVLKLIHWPNRQVTDMIKTTRTERVIFSNKLTCTMALGQRS